jgi:hypothetical protein
MIGLGWANQCAQENFTLGWITCAKSIKTQKRLPPAAPGVDGVQSDDEELFEMVQVILMSGVLDEPQRTN